MEHGEVLRDRLKSAVVWRPEQEARLFAGEWSAQGRGKFRVLVLTEEGGLSRQLAESAQRTAEEALGWMGTCLEEQGELLLLAEKGEPQQLMKLLERRHPGPRYLLGVSGLVSPEEVRWGYGEARQAVQINFYRPVAIARAEEITFSRDHDYGELIPLEKKLTNALLSGVHERECHRMVEEYMSYFERRAMLPRLVRDTVFCFLCSLDRRLLFIDPLCSTRLSPGARELVEACPTARTMAEKLTDVLLEVLRTGEADGGSPESYMLRVMDFLRSRLDRVPSQDEISREFHVNKFVFSRQFKEQTGLTVGDYIKRARLEEACRLLRETHLYIYQVAEKVGFQNESSFSIFFKRETGLSPREYRLEHLSEKRG